MNIYIYKYVNAITEVFDLEGKGEWIKGYIDILLANILRFDSNIQFIWKKN